MRDRALDEARGWIGTPYRHRASVKGEGCDCLGLVRGVWRGLYGAEPEGLPPYSPDWAERGGDETLLKAARRWMIQIPVREARAGGRAVAPADSALRPRSRWRRRRATSPRTCPA